MAASEEENHQIEEMYSILHAYDHDALITGEGALTKDLITTADKDFQVVNVLSIAADLRDHFADICLFLAAVRSGACHRTGDYGEYGSPLFHQHDASVYCRHRDRYDSARSVCGLCHFDDNKEQRGTGASSDIKTAVRIAVSKSAPSIITSGCSFFAACIGVALNFTHGHDFQSV